MIMDTYVRVGKEKKYITKNTVIHSKNSLIKSILKNPFRENTENEIKHVFFLKKDEASDVLSEFKDLNTEVEDTYLIKIENDSAFVYADSPRAELYGACRMQMYCNEGISEEIILNVPLCATRAVKIYIPARGDIEFFKKFVDMCLYYGYNTIFIEVGGAMEYKKHPEINEGWVEYCKIFQEYPNKSKDVQNCVPYNKNSVHWENGGGSYLTQEEIKDLVKYCREREIDVVPEIPSLSHSDYLLTRHAELAEYKDDPLPDTYCPSNENTYKLLFDVIDEVISVFEPKMVHIAHDEWFGVPLCEKCAQKLPEDIFAEDVNRIYNYIKKRGIDVMLWGDRLLNCRLESGEPWAGGGIRIRKVKSDKNVNIKGVMYPVYNEYWGEEVDDSEGGTTFCCAKTYKCIEKMPEDIKVMNWSFRMKCGEKFSDYELHRHKLWNIYGNFNFGMMEFENWFERINDGVKGICISNWSVLDERHMQRNAIFLSLAYGKIMLWNRNFDEKKSAENIIDAAHNIFKYHYKEAVLDSYIEIVHTIDVVIPHPPFVDGCCMIEDNDRIGYYNIYYEDGTTQKYDIYWGYNIGTSGGADLKPGQMLDGMIQSSTYTMEPTYTCDYVTDYDKLYYRLIIPVRRRVKRVEPEIFEKYAGDTYVKSIKIINAQER